MGLFDSLVGLATDAVKIVIAPVEIVVDIVSVPVKEIAEVATDLAKDVKDTMK